MKSDKKLSNQNLIVIVVSLAIAMVAILRANHGHHGEVSSWHFTHYLFNFEYGYVKRGLIGEIIRLSIGQVDYLTVKYLSHVLFYLAVVVLIFVTVLPAMDAGCQKGSIYFVLLVLTSPATIQHFYFDMGRFDVVTLTIALISILIIFSFNNRIKYVFLFALMCVSVLVHEATFFIYIPIVFSFLIYNSKTRGEYLICFFYAVSAVLLTFIVSSYGLIEVFDLEEHEQMLKNKYGEIVNASSLAVLHRGSLGENILYTLERGFTIYRIIHHILFFLCLAPVFICLTLAIRALTPVVTRKEVLILTSALSPLLLYPIGIDHFRWWALAITNVFIALSMISFVNHQFRDRLYVLHSQYRSIVFTAIVVGLVTGPICNVTSYDLFTHLELYIKSM